MNARFNHFRRRGFSLAEVLVAIGLMMFLMALAAEVFGATFRVYRNGNSFDARVHSADAAMRILRQDCWNARSLRADGATAEIEQSDGRRILWKIEPDAAMTRWLVNAGQHAAAAGRWESAGTNLSFSSDGSALVVSEKRDPHTATAVLESQFILAEGKPVAEEGRR